MPNQSEIHIAFTADQFDLAKEKLGIEIDFDEIELSGATLPKIQQQMLEVYDRALKEVGFTPRGENPQGYWIVETPAGERLMAPFSLELCYDPGEMMESPEHATIGVALSGRYYPTFIDYESESGGLQPAHEINMSLIERVKKLLVDTFPIFDKAKILIREKFY